MFLIVAVAANRQDPLRAPQSPVSGTGGFALFAETTLPLTQSPGTTQGREALGLPENGIASVVEMRVRDGDDASCLNLNRSRSPRILGVDSRLLEGRFTFGSGSGWSQLRDPGGDIPAIADASTLAWGLGLSVGDTLALTDEQGRPFRIRIAGALAGSILQGALLIDESRFAEKFPSVSGYRVFLVDSSTPASTAADLERALVDAGITVQPARQRLAEFLAVQNTYLSVFQALGGLGLLLGTAGLAVLVLRNVLERRSELALMNAVGFRRRRIARFVFTEHAALVAAGLLAGGAASLLAVWPGLTQPGMEIPWSSLAVTLAAVTACALLWTWLAARSVLRGTPVEALRSE